MARRRYGYRASEVAKVLGYTSHGGVLAAVRRMEKADARLQSRLKKAEARLASS